MQEAYIFFSGVLGFWGYSIQNSKYRFRRRR